MSSSEHDILAELTAQADACRVALARCARFFELLGELRKGKALLEQQEPTRKNSKALERLTRQLADSLKEEPIILQAKAAATETLAAIQAEISRIAPGTQAGATGTMTA